jgi:hypothetical protein
VENSNTRSDVQKENPKDRILSDIKKDAKHDAATFVAALTGPSYYPEDHQSEQLPSIVEQESVPPKRADAGQSHNEIIHNEKKKINDSRSIEDRKLKLAEYGKPKNRKAKKITDSRSIEDGTLKKRATRSQRQETRWYGIFSRTRTTREDTTPPSVSPTQEAEQYNDDQDEQDITPGAVRVPGMDSMDLKRCSRGRFYNSRREFDQSRQRLE